MKEFQNERDPQPRRGLKRCWVLLAPLALALLWTGCKPEGADAKAATDADPTGVYTLVSIDGKNAPCKIEHGGHTMEIKSGSFAINADATCSSKMFLAGREAPIEVKATYQREGPQLTMRWRGAGMTLGRLEGSTFTMTNEGMVLVYRK